MQTLGSVQSSQNDSSNPSLFSDMLGQVLQASTGSQTNEDISSLLYSGKSPVFVPSSVNSAQSGLANLISSYSPLLQMGQTMMKLLNELQKSTMFQKN